MITIHRLLSFGLLSIALLSISACASGLGRTPEVGSKAWCAFMDKKSKGDWSINEAADYARHCLLN
jgi:Protein of unknown function (DUF3012)